MRKRLTLLLALCLTAVMAYGVIGSSALFTFHGQVQQAISVGTLGLTISSDTAGASGDGQTVTCPAITVAHSAAAWDMTGCHIRIAAAPNTIAPDKVQLKISVWTNGADLSKFMVQFNEGAGSWSPPMYGDTPMLDALPDGTVVSTTTVVPADLYTYLGWHELSNGDMGKTVVVTYSLDASA